MRLIVVRPRRIYSLRHTWASRGRMSPLPLWPVHPAARAASRDGDTERIERAAEYSRFSTVTRLTRTGPQAEIGKDVERPFRDNRIDLGIGDILHLVQTDPYSGCAAFVDFDEVNFFVAQSISTPSSRSPSLRASSKITFAG